MLSKEWLNAFVAVGSLRENQWGASGAAFFFSKPPLIWLITSKHVVDRVAPADLAVLVPGPDDDGALIVPIGRIIASHGLVWVRDEPGELAAAPMPLSHDFRIKAVEEANCLRISEVMPSMPCFIIGCPYGLQGLDPARAIPLVLDGVIAGVDSRKQRIYTSTQNIPGNAGGPLIAIRSPFDPTGAMVAGRPTVLLAGVMLESATILPPSASNRNPPLHVGVAAPSDAIHTLLDSEEARSMETRISYPEAAAGSPP